MCSAPSPTQRLWEETAGQPLSSLESQAQQQKGREEVPLWVGQVGQGFPPGEVEAGVLEARRSLCELWLWQWLGQWDIYRWAEAKLPAPYLSLPSRQRTPWSTWLLRLRFSVFNLSESLVASVSKMYLSGAHILLHLPCWNPGLCHQPVTQRLWQPWTGLPAPTLNQSLSHMCAPQGCQKSLSKA